MDQTQGNLRAMSDVDAFLRASGWADRVERQPLTGDASSRQYERLLKADGATAMLMIAGADMQASTANFVRIADHLRAQGLSTPHIFAADIAHGLLVTEDFGDNRFERLIAEDPQDEIRLYEAACDVLEALQDVPPLDLPILDAPTLTEMIEPAFEWYGRTDQQTFRRFAALFEPVAGQMGSQTVIMLRDYHVENLMLLPDRKGIARVGLLDFQDAMLAHPAYDLVSILQDARRDVSEGLEEHMIRRFLAQTQLDETDFRKCYAILGLQRNLRILGIFARLSLRDGKHGYLTKIPRVWAYVERNLRHPVLAPVAMELHDMLPQPSAEPWKERPQC